MSGDDLADRLDALERTVVGDADESSDESGGDGTAATGSREAPTRSGDLLRLERRVDDLETTVEELEAAVQAVRGYAGNVRAVNRDVERRASAALAKAEALETAVGSATADASGQPRGSGDAPPHDGDAPPHDGDLSREPTVIADSDRDRSGDGRSQRRGPGRRGSEPTDAGETDDASDPGGTGDFGDSGDTVDFDDTPDTRDPGDPADPVDPGTDEPGDGDGDGSDTDRFVQRVRDAI